MAEIIDYTAPATANPYTQDVADLIAAGEGKAAKITVDADKVKGAALKFRQAANAADRTARQRDTIENGDGTVSLVFTLTDKYGSKAKHDAPEQETAPEPETAQEEAPADEATPEPRKRR